MVAAAGRFRFEPAQLNPVASSERAGVALRRASAFLLLGLLCAVPARAQPGIDASDRSTAFATSLNETVQVPAGERVEQDLLALGSAITIEGEAAGDAVAIRGDVIVTGHVAGDAIALGGRVRVGRGGRIDGNAFSLFGGVDLAEGAVVEGRSRSLAPLAPGETAGYFTVSYSQPALVARFLVLVFWILAALVAAFAAPTTVARAAAELSRHPLRLGGIGILLAVSFVLTLVFFVALIPLFVGIPLLVLLVLAAVGLVSLALAAAFHAAGSSAAERLSNAAVSGYVELLAGALVLGLLQFVPLLGELLWCVAILAGAGAVTTTRLGRQSAAA
jgi:hypothetical protein